jgi:predicted N-acyltransferase
MAHMLSVEILDSVTGVNPSEWDELVEEDVLARHGWLRTVEESFIPYARPRYVLIRDGGRLIAATSCHSSEATDPVFTPDDLFFGRFKDRARNMGLSLLPALVCGFPSGVGRDLLVSSSVSASLRTLVVGKLLDALEDIASEQGLSLFFRSVFGSEVEVLNQLELRGFNKTTFFPPCYLDIEWASFEEYIGHLKAFSKMPQNVRREIRLNRNAGINIEPIQDVRPHQTTLFDLADRHWFRYNQMPFPYRPDFFAKAQDNLGSDAVFYGAFRASDLIGFMLLLKGPHTAHALEIGIDHDASRKEATYFNLGYYAPIRDTIGTRIKRLYFGSGLPEIKIRRGCKRRATHLLYRANGRIRNKMLRPLFFLHSQQLQHKISAQAKAVHDGSFSRSRRKHGSG